MSDPRLTIAKRELSGLRKEKTIVLALGIQLFIAAFSSFLVVGLVSLYDPGSVEGYSVDVAVAGDAADELVAVAARQDGLDPTHYESPVDARASFASGRSDALLVADRTERGRVGIEATVPDGNIRTTLIVVQLKDAFEAYERAEREAMAERLDTMPVELPPEQRSNPYYDFTYTVLVPLLLFLPVFISGSITVDSITEELDRGTLELLRVAPVSLAHIVDGKLLANAALAPAQAALWLALLGLNGTRVANVPVLLALVGAFSLLLTAASVAVSLLAPDRRIAQPVYSVCALGVVGAGAVLSHGPVNTVARLAIDSAGSGTIAAAVGYVLVAIGVYAATRWLVGRTDAATL